MPETVQSPGGRCTSRETVIASPTLETLQKSRESGTGAARGRLKHAFTWWALVVSNHRSPPCQGEAKVLFSGLSRSARVPLSAVESL
jgi:hypothetical protein